MDLSNISNLSSVQLKNNKQTLELLIELYPKCERLYVAIHFDGVAIFNLVLYIFSRRVCTILLQHLCESVYLGHNPNIHIHICTSLFPSL